MMSQLRCMIPSNAVFTLLNTSNMFLLVAEVKGCIMTVKHRVELHLLIE